MIPRLMNEQLLPLCIICSEMQTVCPEHSMRKTVSSKEQIKSKDNNIIRAYFCNPSIIFPTSGENVYKQLTVYSMNVYFSVFLLYELTNISLL